MRGAARQGDPLALLIVAAGCRANSPGTRRESDHRNARIAPGVSGRSPQRRRAREKPGRGRRKAWNPGTNLATHSRPGCCTGIETRPLADFPQVGSGATASPRPSRSSRGTDRIPVSKRESAQHDARHPLTRLGGPPNACRLAHRSKARHRDRQTALTGQPCSGEQANAKNDVEWRHRDRDHAGR